ncbi:hypothetical protein MMC25_002469 [Agyrium rufum]|nr:hypothetical protein [Agyrium rufum]
MGDDEYFVAGGGGLKLKGMKDSKVDKDKKKKRKKRHAEQVDDKPEEEQSTTAEDTEKGESTDRHGKDLMKALDEELDDEDRKAITTTRGKTEAEKRHEERRRQRLDERLKREGVKTHKERVEELNRYLSNLSEHHDMYATPHHLSTTANGYLWKSTVRRVANISLLRALLGPVSALVKICLEHTRPTGARHFLLGYSVTYFSISVL